MGGGRGLGWGLGRGAGVWYYLIDHRITCLVLLASSCRFLSEEYSISRIEVRRYTTRKYSAIGTFEGTQFFLLRCPTETLPCISFDERYPTNHRVDAYGTSPPARHASIYWQSAPRWPPTATPSPSSGPPTQCSLHSPTNANSRPVLSHTYPHPASDPSSSSSSRPPTV